MNLYLHSSIWGSIRKFPGYYCCNCLSERWRVGRPRSHFRKPFASACHMTLHCTHTLFSHECFFDFVFGWFLNGIHILMLDECQLKITNVQGNQAPTKCQNMLNILRTCPRILSVNNPWARKHHWNQLWSLPRDLNTKFEHALHCRVITTMHSPTRPWKPQCLWLTTTWLSFPILHICQT
jgi:hypothetical protein